MAEEAEDQQIEAYIGALDEDWTEEGEEEETEDDVVLTSEALEALADVDAVTKHVFQGDTNGDDANETNGTIIMDADGNYYFHTSEKTIEVKPLKFNDSSKLIKIQSATVVKKGIKGFKADELAKQSKAAAKKNGNKGVKINGNTIVGDQTSTTDDINTNQTDLNAYELIIPETEAEFYALNKTNTNEVDQQDTTTATEAAIHTMTVYDCKNCTFKTNSADLLENHLETCEKIKGEKKQEAAVLVKRKVGRPSKKYSSSKNKEKSKNRTSSKEKEKQQHDEYMNDDYEVNDPDYNPENEVEVRSEALMKSITSDTPSEEFKCPHCSYVAPKKFSLSRHLKTHSDDRPYKCSICEKGFKTAASLQNHVNTHLGNKPHVCGDCGKSFTTSGELVRHSRYRHTGIRPHKCTECDYASVEMSKLKRHMRCHTGERPYQCPHCTYASPDSFKLKRHMRTHTGEKPYECDICHARFTQSNSLKYHRLIHSVNEKPVFQCPMCPTTCGRKTDLRLHIQNLHSTDKAWPCNRCGKELPDRYSYKMHIKSHEGEKCFQCKYCPYASVLQRHLTIHMLLHTDEKPFKCDTCDMPFRQKMLLQRHINVYHTGEYVPPKPREKSHACPHCEKTFCFKGNLIRHMEIHDPTSAVEQRQFELKLGRLIRVSDEKNKMNEDAEVAANGGGGDYNEADDDEAAIVESLVDHNELEYHNEVADDENDEEEEAYYLYEEIEEDEKPSLMNSLEYENKSISQVKPATKQTIDKVKTEKEQLNNVKVEKETPDNVVVIEIMQCADDTLMEDEEETNLMETSEIGEEIENHEKKKLNTLEIIDNTKNNTVIFEEVANAELMDDEQRIEFFEITEAN